MEISLINLIIIVIISFVIGFFTSYFINKPAEHLINLDDSRKVELSKCCTNDKCYNKPPYLRDNCQTNKENSTKSLDTQFKQMYTQEEYYKLLNELNILKDKTNPIRDTEYMAKLNSLLTTKENLDDKTFKTIITDDRDEVRGFNDTTYASYKPTNK